MRLYEKNGKLYFDYENAEENIFEDEDYFFFYKGRGIREYVPWFSQFNVDYPHEADWVKLGEFAELCKAKGVTITPSAQKYIAEFRAKAEAEKAEHDAHKAAQRALIKRASAKKEWASKQKNGCSAYPCCPNLYYEGDVPKCKCDGNPAEKNVGTDPKYMYACFNDGLSTLFAFKAFPGNTCPLRTDEPMTEEENAALKYSYWE